MSTPSINHLAGSALESILSSALQNAAPAAKNSASSSVGQAPDNGQVSPLAHLLSTLQQLQQSDPSKFQQVTQQIASNLQSAAQTAQSGGDTTTASQLNQLATDFTNAANSGQPPNVQNLAHASGGHHHHHSHGGSSQPPQNDPLNPLSIIQNTLTNAGITV